MECLQHITYTYVSFPYNFIFLKLDFNKSEVLSRVEYNIHIS